MKCGGEGATSGSSKVGGGENFLEYHDEYYYGCFVFIFCIDSVCFYLCSVDYFVNIHILIDYVLIMLLYLE